MGELDFTLTAGPTEASAATLSALGAPITYHYDPLFLAKYKEAEEKLGAFKHLAAPYKKKHPALAVHAANSSVFMDFPHHRFDVAVGKFNVNFTADADWKWHTSSSRRSHRLPPLQATAFAPASLRVAHHLVYEPRIFDQFKLRHGVAAGTGPTAVLQQAVRKWD